MASYDPVGVQFDRAVEIVQSLPKTGPIQTDYEEKLTMYSLFKQATSGNVKGPRPGIWDMLGRAKWDAWAKHKDIESNEAKQLYVEALLKVLRKYSDKTVARRLVEELESFGDHFDPVLSRSSNRSPGSDASGSTLSDISASATRQVLPGQYPRAQPNGFHPAEDEESAEEDLSDEEARGLPPMNSTRMPLDNRPPSSLSSQQRYRTPLANSLAMSPTPSRSIPSQQPLPSFETPSAFDGTPRALPNPHQLANQSPVSFTQPQTVYPYPGNSRNQMRPYTSTYEAAPSTALERAVEGVQVHLAALTERLEVLESRSFGHSRSHNNSGSLSGPVSSSWLVGGSSQNTRGGGPQWDIDDLGMWSLVLHPLSYGLVRLKEFATFFARNEERSPSMIIVRRLCLDVSFLMTVVMLVGALWRKSGVRRREVKAALVILWRAILGTKPPRQLVHLDLHSALASICASPLLSI
ncbi:acyl CoA binding protein-domain-containing protein [Crepidotus variabilis]|uniref:Acyl CoA binding protein-domain-containing protein n=1 Tax=Crepidotus variabilis TaxID=179855 RepID=A0A9P6ETW6_9AGAR|nr:acyl CoA binding protein-domain-containing protein [Crepidotus variabilis]